jgi:hypothetical protein
MLRWPALPLSDSRRTSAATPSMPAPVPSPIPSKGAMAPDWISSYLVRGYRFLGPNRVELSVITNAEGQRVTNGQILAWERIDR